MEQAERRDDFESVVWCLTLLYFLSINILKCSNSSPAFYCHRCFWDRGPLWRQLVRKQGRRIRRLQSDVEGTESAGLMNAPHHEASFST